MKENLKVEIPLFVLALLPLLITVAMWNQLPAKVPIHWNASGEIDNYGSPWFLPFFAIGMYFFLAIIPYVDPKTANHKKFQSVYALIRVFVLLLFLGIQASTLAIVMGYSNFPMDKFIMVGVVTLFAVIGLSMKNIKQNYFIGVRTPWTLESEEVWDKTHKMTGQLWLYASIVTGILMLTIPNSSILILPYIIIVVTIPIVYSYILYKKIKKTTKI